MLLYSVMQSDGNSFGGDVVLDSFSKTYRHILVVICCISLNIYILQSLSKLKIFIIKIPKDFFFIFLVFNAVFITVYHDKAVRDDISAKSVPIWLLHTVYPLQIRHPNVVLIIKLNNFAGHRVSCKTFSNKSVDFLAHIVYSMYV